MTAIDLDAPPAAPPALAPAARFQQLPWIIAGITTVAAFLLLVIILARPIPQPEPEPAPLADPVVTAEYSEGLGTGPTVIRDGAGQIIGWIEAVRPYGEEEVWCRLVVDGKPLEAHATGGQPAICAWVRGAA